MKFYFLVVVIVLIIYQVGYVGPNQVPAPQQPHCVIGQYPPPQQVPLVPVQSQQPHVPQQWSLQPCNTLQQPPCAMGQQPLPQVPSIPVQPQPPHVQQQWLQQPPCVIAQQPPPQPVPPAPVQQQELPHIPPNTGQQLQQHYVPPHWPQQLGPQQPCNTLQQPPSGPQNPGLTYPPQTGANSLGQQGMLPQPPYPPQYPQPYPPPSGYSQPPVVYPGGCYPPVLGAYPRVNPAGCCNPIRVSHSTKKLVCWEGSGESSEENTDRRILVWCTCTKCKDVVPLLLGGDKDNIVSFGSARSDRSGLIFPLSQRCRTNDRPKVRIEFRQHMNPANAVRKVFMLFY